MGGPQGVNPASPPTTPAQPPTLQQVAATAQGIKQDTDQAAFSALAATKNPTDKNINDANAAKDKLQEDVSALSNPGKRAALGLPDAVANGLQQRAEGVLAASGTIPMRSHEVAEGQNLSDIAKDKLGDPNRWQEIVDANKAKYPQLADNPDVIQPGWKLDIPPMHAAANPSPADPASPAPGAPAAPTAATPPGAPATIPPGAPAAAPLSETFPGLAAALAAAGYPSQAPASVPGNGAGIEALLVPQDMPNS